MNRSLITATAIVVLLTLGAPVWAQAPERPALALTHLVELLGAVILVFLVLLGSAAFALFWEGVLEHKIARGLSTLQNRLGLSTALGFGVVVVVMALGRLAHGTPALGGIVFIVALVGLWLAALGLVAYARWIGQRYFLEGRAPWLATAKGIIVVLLMGLVFPVGTFALLLLAVSGLGAMVYSWRGEAAGPASAAAAPEGPAEA
ncbi:hypothetical protein HS125_15295 [bacterium]|nr:hypothetical protein [bacterium]